MDYSKFKKNGKKAAAETPVEEEPAIHECDPVILEQQPQELPDEEKPFEGVAESDENEPVMACERSGKPMRILCLSCKHSRCIISGYSEPGSKNENELYLSGIICKRKYDEENPNSAQVYPAIRCQNYESIDGTRQTTLYV